MILLPDENPTALPALPPGMILLGMARHTTIITGVLCEAWVVTIRFSRAERTPFGGPLYHLEARGIATELHLATAFAVTRLRDMERKLLDDAEARRENAAQLDLSLSDLTIPD